MVAGAVDVSVVVVVTTGGWDGRIRSDAASAGGVTGAEVVVVVSDEVPGVAPAGPGGDAIVPDGGVAPLVDESGAVVLPPGGVAVVPSGEAADGELPDEFMPCAAGVPPVEDAPGAREPSDGEVVDVDGEIVDVDGPVAVPPPGCCWA